MDRLIDYLFFVGPGRGSVFRRSSSLKRSTSSSASAAESLISWHKISRPVPTILCHFPLSQKNEIPELPLDVAYFCQPEGPCVHLSEPQIHVFMLTDTESNTQTYGICLSLAHLFDPLLKAQTLSSSAVNKKTMTSDPLNDSESVCIQEWGVLSVCILTRHPFFQFFAKCLKTLAHFVDHFGGRELNWNAIIQAQIMNSSKNLRNGATSQSTQQIVQEVLEWVNKLVSLHAPSPHINVLEIELEVDPATMVSYPPPNRLPLFQLHVHRLFQRLEVCFVIDIYKLVLSEEKVVLHSHDVAFVSECVLTIVALLYPLQYLFPVIPLLPTSMPTAENLLMVPTPFFVGVCTSFMKKVNEVHRSETWIVDLDAKEVHSPSLPDKPPLEFPFSILQLQADIRRAMDKLESHRENGSLTPDKYDSNKPSPRDGRPLLDTHTTATTTTTATTATSNQAASSLSFSLREDTSSSSSLRDLGDDVDVMIRIAFIEFLFSPEILGLIERHLCVFRLFPRPVVTLKQVAFISSYEGTCSNTDKTFIKELIQSQCVEYFQEWSLNPPNYSFDEIRKGTKGVERLSDKQTHYIHRMGARTDQSCLYNTLSDSVLYHEMLSFKASQASSFSVVTEGELHDDDSDWEIVAEGDYYDGGSENSPVSPTYYSDENVYPRPPYVLATSSRRFSNYELEETDEEDNDSCFDDERIRIRGDVDLQHSDDEIEVGFSLRGGLANPPATTGGASRHPVPSAEDGRNPPSHSKLRKNGQNISVHPTVTHPSNESAINQVPTSHRYQQPQYHRKRGSDKKQPKSLGDDFVFTTSTPKGGAPPTTSWSLQHKRGAADRSKNSSIANSARINSASCPKDLMLSNRSLSESPENGMASHFTPRRRIAKEIDVIPPSTSEEDEAEERNGSLSAYRRRRRPQPLRRFDFDPPLLHVPPLSGSSSSLEYNPPSSSSVEVKKSLSDNSTKNKTREEETDSPLASRTLALPATAGMIQTSRTLENQIQDLVTKITEGQGLPWPKPAHLKRLASYEKTRVMLLRQLEVKLKVRQPDEFVMATEPQIAHVATTRAVFKGLHDLLKYLLQCVEEELQKDSEASIFSVFLILRLAFSVHLPPPKQKTGGGGGLSFFSALFGSDDSAQERSKMVQKDSIEMESVLGSSGKVTEECDGGTKGDTKKEEEENLTEDGRKLELSGDLHRPVAGEEEFSPRDDSGHGGVVGEDDRGREEMEEPLSSPLSPPRVGDGDEGGDISRQRSLDFADPLTDVTHSYKDGSPVRTIGSASSAFTPTSKALLRAHPIATPPSGQLHTQPHDLPTANVNGDLSDLGTAGEKHNNSLSPVRANQNAAKSSPLRMGRAVSPSHQLLLELLETPRVYYPSETSHRLAGCVLLYKELVRSLGNTRNFLMEKKFWNVLFMSTISVDRNQLGWNEKTTELYTRYNTLTEEDRHLFGLEEDNLLSIILHNLLVFMLMVGMGQEETSMLIHCFAAKTRLATSEEKLLQQTLKYIEKKASTELDLSSLGLLTLYSEVHPTISYIVHYGINVVAPVYKLQLTSEALILRRFPDESITSRLWNDHVMDVHCNKERSTVTVRYKDSNGEYNHHFHTKQFTRVYESLLKLIPELSDH